MASFRHSPAASEDVIHAADCEPARRTFLFHRRRSRRPVPCLRLHRTSEPSSVDFTDRPFVFAVLVTDITVWLYAFAQVGVAIGALVSPQYIVSLNFYFPGRPTNSRSVVVATLSIHRTIGDSIAPESISVATSGPENESAISDCTRGTAPSIESHRD